MYILSPFYAHDCLGGIRGKYARRYVQGTNVVMLDPDVVRIFPNAVAVNSFMHALPGTIRRQNLPR